MELVEQGENAAFDLVTDRTHGFDLRLAGSAVGTLLRVRETRFDATTVVRSLSRGPRARARA